MTLRTDHARTVSPLVLDQLADLEAARQSQLDALPSTDLDPVTAAHRGTVEKILAELRVARQRAADGCYGTCVRCGGEISVHRLELRPWVVKCTPCASRDHA